MTLRNRHIAIDIYFVSTCPNNAWMIGTIYNYQHFSAGNYGSLYSSGRIDNNTIVTSCHTFITYCMSHILAYVLGNKKIVEVSCDADKHFDTGDRKHHHQYDHSLCISVRCLKVRHWDYCIVGQYRTDIYTVDHYRVAHFNS